MIREKKIFVVARAITLTCALGLLGCDDDDDDGMAPNDIQAPPTPTGVYTITGDESIEIFWNPLIGADVAGYEIYSSLDADGPYSRLSGGRVSGEDEFSFLVAGLENGVTHYYAVAAFDFDGNLSALSSEYVLVHDTPRPAGQGLMLDVRNAARSALDWSEYGDGNAGIIVPYDDNLADFVLEEGTGPDEGRLFLVGTAIVADSVTYLNQLQDYGYTYGLDDVDWAPDNEDPQTWALSAFGVEVIAGHSYIVWTWDDYYAKFRVSAITPTTVTLDWAYQATNDYDFRFELAPGRKGGVR